jgi:hypothetical protein
MNSSGWVNPTLQARSHTDPLLAGFTMYGDPSPADDFLAADDSEQAFEASLEEEPSIEADEPFEEVEEQEAVAEVVAAEVKPAPVVPSPAVMARPGPPPGGSQYQQTQYQQTQPEPQYPSQQPQQAEHRQEPERVAEYGGADEEGAHPLVEETMARLDELRERPVGEHAEVYADLHERLQSALVEADAEHGDRV